MQKLSNPKSASGGNLNFNLRSKASNETRHQAQKEHCFTRLIRLLGLIIGQEPKNAQEASSNVTGVTCSILILYCAILYWVVVCMLYCSA
jgi:hypothetical protein